MKPSAVLWTRKRTAGLEYVLDCAHATTTAVILAEHPDLTEHEVISVLQERHEATCECGRRYLRSADA